MVCRRCRTANSDSSVYCSQCGSPLVRRPTDTKRGIPWYGAAIGVVVLLAAGFILSGLFSRRGPAPVPGIVAPDTTRGEEPVQVREASRGDDRDLRIDFGEVLVFDSRGAEVSRAAVPVVGEGWFALPLSALFGGAALEYHGHGPDDHGAVPVAQGLWAAGEPIALWRIERGSKAENGSIDLRPWRQTLPLEWHAIAAEGGAYRVDAGPAVRRTISAGIALPFETRQPGFFVQDGRVVGWTFGGGMETGYLWTGQPGGGPEPNVSAEELMGAIVAPSREAAFARAMSMGGASPAAEKLRALAAAFDQVPLLAAQDLPPRLRAEVVTREMHALATGLIRTGGARDVMAVLNPYVLAEAGDPELVKDVVLAVAAGEDYNKAVRYLERLKTSLAALPNATRALAGIDAFHGRLYKDWIREIVEKGGYYSGESAYEEARRTFPGDAEIHLLGVEVALAADDHERAEERLKAREYQGTAKTWADKLAARLQAHEESQTVVVRFGPRDQQIRLDATINGMRRQEFIVDTGANTSSIPSSAVRALGIKIDDSTQVVGVATAGGVGLAYKVALDSVEIEGFIVRNLEVLVIDLPYDDDTGLLGLDFLRNFRYEIDNSQGTLLLRKK